MMRSQVACRDPGVAWNTTSDATACTSCRAVFSVLKLRTRHHCRTCGFVFCSRCCPIVPTGAEELRQCLWCAEVPRWIQPTYYSEDLAVYETGKKGLATVSVRSVMDSYARRTVLSRRRLLAVNPISPTVAPAAPAAASVGSVRLAWPVPLLPSGPMVNDKLCRRSLLWMQPQSRLYLFCSNMQTAATSYAADSAFEPLRYHRSIQDVLPTFQTTCRAFGRGAYGAVYLFKPSPEYHRHCTSEFIVLKIVKKLVVRDPTAARTVDDVPPPAPSRASIRHPNRKEVHATWLQSLTEIQMLGTIHHENVAGLVDAFQTRDSIVIVQEAGDGGSLWGGGACHRLRGAGGHLLHLAAHTAKHVAAGLRCMYEDHGIIHRDLKAENIVLSKDLSRVMIVDLGFAQFVTPRDDEELKHFNNCGTAGYAPPEVIQWVAMGRNATSCTGYALHQGDLFSLGVILYMLVANCYTPFSLYYPERARRLPSGALRPLRQINQLLPWTHCLRTLDAGFRATAPEFRGTNPEEEAMFAGFRPLLEGLLACPYRRRWTAEQVINDAFVQQASRDLGATIQNLANDLGNEVQQEAAKWDLCDESGPTRYLDEVEIVATAEASEPPPADE